MAYGAILGQTTPLASVVASGNMNAVTSDAVYQAIAAIPEGAKIVTGSYVGTGTYGSSNPCSLTFDDTPKIWGFLGYRETITYTLFNSTVYAYLWGNDECINIGPNLFPNTVNYTDKTVNWYTRSGVSSPSAEKQFNKSNVTYCYFAIFY